MSNKNSQEDDTSCLGMIVQVLLIGAVIWVLVLFNPTEQKHRELISEKIISIKTEMLLDNHFMRPSDQLALKQIKFYNLGICSLTTYKKSGDEHLATFGVLGYIFTFFGYR